LLLETVSSLHPDFNFDVDRLVVSHQTVYPNLVSETVERL
jgi:hypothetical protein